MDAPHALRLRRLGALGGELVVAFRGADTTKYVARRGPRVYRRTFHDARLLLPVCEFLGRRLVALGAPPERVVVHRTGIDLRRWPYRERGAASDGRLRLVTVGRLVEKKGIEYLLRAVRILADRRVDVECRILGDGPRRDRLAALAAELGIADRVHFQGRHEQETVRDGIDGSDILVAASVTAADGDEEGIPNVLKEAMALGLPVVGNEARRDSRADRGRCLRLPGAGAGRGRPRRRARSSWPGPRTVGRHGARGPCQDRDASTTSTGSTTGSPVSSRI